ncbi:quercetin dioxygenase-like cupin family protein [Haloferula luteola]|uniref:Quercetin dioxygenase-like cupin family protein n=1 Tax=Haloferula luteola TaxID=595692 RepID=A0A840VC22_9BACT|nr:cupin domain-containing protein [Haloferula luteola]MBB5350421.1 quercetin dioxygenase-like cupin family protein [Haloferula luteola]
MPDSIPPFITAENVVHEDNDWTHNEWLCRPDFTPLKHLLMVRAHLQAGHGHPFHRHPHREEIIHIVSGRAEQWVGESCQILGPGEIAVIPAGVVHATYNPFPVPLVFHAILSPAELPPSEAQAPDPEDVSDQEPWNHLRHGRKPCRLLKDQ